MRNRALVFTFVVVPLCGAVLVTFLNATSTFHYDHWQGERMEITRNGRIRIADASDSDVAKPAAKVDHPLHDFGLMNPLTMGRHRFVVRNEGTASLRLTKGSTTCKCTLSHVQDQAIPPGQEGYVWLEWNTGRDSLYHHEAEVHTNDPLYRVLRLQVEGRVRRQLAIEPDVVLFPNVQPDSGDSTSLVLYSQAYSEVTIVDGRSSIEGLKWTLRDVEEIDEALEATWARRLQVDLPAGLAKGDITGWLRLEARVSADATTSPEAAKPAAAPDTIPNGESEDTPSDVATTEFEVPIQGRVRGRLSVMGAAVHGDGVVDFGHVRSYQGATQKLLLKSRDPDPTLKIKQVSADPAFLQIQLVREDGQSEDSGTAYLEIAIPENAPHCSYLGVPLGEVTIEFDHPRLEKLVLRPKFAVTP